MLPGLLAICPTVFAPCMDVDYGCHQDVIRSKWSSRDSPGDTSGTPCGIINRLSLQGGFCGVGGDIQTLGVVDTAAVIVGGRKRSSIASIKSQILSASARKMCGGRTLRLKDKP